MTGPQLIDPPTLVRTSGVFKAARPRHLGGGELIYDEAGTHPLEYRITRHEPLFLATWVWRKRCLMRRPIASIKQFESVATNLLFLDGVGHVEFRSTTHVVRVEAGQFFCTKPDRAYHVEIFPAAGEVLEILHIMAPTSELSAPLHGDNPLFAPIDRIGPDWDIAYDLAQLLIAQGQNLLSETILKVASGLFHILSNLARLNGDRLAPRTVGRVERIRQIEQFIERSLSDTELSAGKVALECGISRRYLSALLHSAGTTCPRLVNQKRVALAQRLMKERPTSGMALKTIAALSGFRSYSRFYQAFVGETGHAPGDMAPAG